MTVQLATADAARIPLPDQSVQCCVTSPPYWGLRKYAGVEGAVWPSVTYTPMAGLAPVRIPGDAECEHVWGEEQIVAAKVSHGQGGSTLTGGHESWGNREGGTTGSYCQRCGAWRGELGLEPTPEMFVAHLVLVFREVWRVLRDDGVCWLNLGDSYASTPPGNTTKGVSAKSTLHGVNSDVYRETLSQGVQTKQNTVAPCLKPKDLCGIPWRVAFALQADGWWLRSDIIWHKTNPMPESVTDRCTKSHEYLFLLAKNARYYYDHEAVKEGAVNVRGGAPKKIHDDAAQGPHGETSALNKPWGGSTARNKRTVWTISTKPYHGAHFATFPPDLVEPCIKAGTSERGACPECGAPWERVVEKERYTDRPQCRPMGTRGNQPSLNASLGQPQQGSRYCDNQTTGWQPTCDHDAEPIPCVVLDPFAGSGTTGLVARELGRDAVLLDLSHEYLVKNATVRLELDKLRAWGQGNGRKETNLAGLPLWEGVA